MRRIAAISTLALSLLSPASPVAAEDAGFVDEAHCTSMTVRLEPSTSGGSPVPHEYVLRTAPDPTDCSWTKVVPGALPRTLTATVGIYDIFRGSGTCTDDACWPVLCQGFLADGSLDVLVTETGGLGRQTDFRADDAVRVNHLNPGFGAPTVLAVEGIDRSGAVVAVSGNFVRSGGDCAGGTASGWVEFRGSLVAFDPPLPELPGPGP